MALSDDDIIEGLIGLRAIAGMMADQATRLMHAIAERKAAAQVAATTEPPPVAANEGGRIPPHIKTLSGGSK